VLNTFVAITPGLEEALRDELHDLGIEGRVVPGGVTFHGDHAAVYAVHLHSRVAARVSVTVGEVPARSLEQLAGGVRGLDWRPFVWPGQPVRVSATARQSRLHHRGTLEKKVAHAVTDALKGPRLPGPRPPREPALVGVHVHRDRATLTVDASGDLLHRRGWRKATAKAPLRENLAAAVLRLARWAPGEPLVDPMCGAGTFPIEAASVAMGHAPGYRRTFAFSRWPTFDERVWERLRKAARGASALDTRAPILAADRDAGAVRATRANADRAGVGGRLQVLGVELAALRPPSGPGLIVMNPPYGERIGGRSSVGRVYRAIGEALRGRWDGWRVAILLPGPRHLGALGIRLETAASFSNGGIPVILALGELGAAS